MNVFGGVTGFGLSNIFRQTSAAKDEDTSVISLAQLDSISPVVISSSARCSLKIQSQGRHTSTP